VDNLTGDASLDWVTSAATTILIERTRGTAGTLLFPASAVRDAYANNAGRIVHAYFTRLSAKSAALKFTFDVEDVGTHRIIETISGQGNVLDAVDRVARVLSPAARVFSSANTEAVAAWGEGNFERAVELDPDFGTAWAARVRQLANSKKAAEAEEAAGRALSRKSLRSDYQRYEITAMLAELKRDFRGRAQAMEALAGLVPNDLALASSAAQAHTLARNFDAAAALYRKILAVDPGNAPTLNSLGYTEAMAGRLDSAKAVFATYAKQPGQATNALDSLGEAYFLNGRFKDAGTYFQRAYAADPKFLQGRTQIKAAYAQWLGGDLPGADRIFDDYAAKHPDPAMPLVQAAWLYSTGRADAAAAKLRSAPVAVKPLVDRQLAVWRAAAGGSAETPNDLARWKNAYETSMPPADAETRTFYASALAAAGKLDEARALVRQWPLPTLGADPFAGSLVYPKFIAVRRKLGMSAAEAGDPEKK